MSVAAPPPFAAAAGSRARSLRPRRAVLFDLYGTLIDIRTDEGDPAVWATLAQYLAYFGVRIAPEEFRSQYSGRVEFQLRSSPEKHPEVDVYQIFHDICEAYARAKVSRERVIAAAMLFRSLTRRTFALFPEAAATLARLRERYLVGLVSDAQWVFTEPELEMTGLRDLFGVRVLSSRLGFKKPDPRIFARALAGLRVGAGDALYVGDNPGRDLLGARRAGMRCILFRPSSNGTGERPDAVVGHHAELGAAVERLLG